MRQDAYPSRGDLLAMLGIAEWEFNQIKWVLHGWGSPSTRARWIGTAELNTVAAWNRGELEWKLNSFSTCG